MRSKRYNLIIHSRFIYHVNCPLHNNVVTSCRSSLWIVHITSWPRLFTTRDEPSAMKGISAPVRCIDVTDNKLLVNSVTCRTFCNPIAHLPHSSSYSK